MVLVAVAVVVRTLHSSDAAPLLQEQSFNVFGCSQCHSKAYVPQGWLMFWAPAPQPTPLQFTAQSRPRQSRPHRSPLQDWAHWPPMHSLPHSSASHTSLQWYPTQLRCTQQPEQQENSKNSKNSASSSNSNVLARWMPRSGCGVRGGGLERKAQKRREKQKKSNSVPIATIPTLARQCTVIASAPTAAILGSTIPCASVLLICVCTVYTFRSLCFKERG